MAATIIKLPVAKMTISALSQSLRSITTPLRSLCLSLNNLVRTTFAIRKDEEKSRIRKKKRKERKNKKCEPDDRSRPLLDDR
ncbi:hypothetical protein Tco_1089435 [Tanacetum coccineum]